MRIGIVGAQNVGKTTLYNTFRMYWPMYEVPEKNYRELIAEKNLSINEEGNLESQTIIRDVLCDIAIANAGKTKTIHDRTILDNLVYSFWLNEYGKLGDTSEVDNFIASSITLTRECMKFYDIIFWLPMNPNIALVESPQRSSNELFREEIDNIFHGVYDLYKQNSGLLFDKENQPTMIVLEGELDDKINTIKEYIDSEGNLITTGESVLGGLDALYDEARLRSQLGMK